MFKIRMPRRASFNALAILVAATVGTGPIPSLTAGEALPPPGGCGRYVTIPILNIKGCSLAVACWDFCYSELAVAALDPTYMFKGQPDGLDCVCVNRVEPAPEPIEN